MAKLNQLHPGSKTQTRIGIIPASLLALDPITRPPDVTVTLGAAITAGALTATVTALTGPIAKGVTLFFTSGVEGTAVLGIVRLTAEAKQGETALAIAPAANAIANGSVASHLGVICVRGLTSTGFSIANQEQTAAEIQCDEDAVAGALVGYAEGTVSSASWSAPLSGNVRDNTVGYQMLKMAAALAVDGVYVWFEHEITPLGGYSKGSLDSGVAQILQFDATSSADGFVTFSSNAAGRGAPTLGVPVVAPVV